MEFFTSDIPLLHKIIIGTIMLIGLGIIGFKVFMFCIFAYMGVMVVVEIFESLTEEEEDYKIRKAERLRIKEWEKMKIVGKNKLKRLEQMRVDH